MGRGGGLCGRVVERPGSVVLFCGGCGRESLIDSAPLHGSCGPAQTLIQHDLIDEYRLLTFPVVLGTGKRLFGAGAVPAMPRLVRSSTTSTNVVASFYRRAGGLKTGSFTLDRDVAAGKGCS
jgi:hypothetical protein